MHSYAEVGWLTPYPDRLLDQIPSAEDEPDAVAVARETIELAFLAALQVLPPRQRAALLAREVLGLPAAETAALLDTSVAAANSALQRARATMQQHLPSHRNDWTARAAERGRAGAARPVHRRPRALRRGGRRLGRPPTDLRVTMPPAPMCFDGLDAVRPAAGARVRPGAGRATGGCCRPSANRMPAAASYLRRSGDTEFRAFKLDVLRVEGGEIAEITTFGYSMFELFGLPSVLRP